MIRDRYKLSAVFAGELHGTFDELGAKCADVYIQMQGSESVTRASHGTLVQEKRIDTATLARMIVDAVKTRFETLLSKQFEQHALRTLEQTLTTINSVTRLGVGVSDAMQKRILEQCGKRAGLVDLATQTRDTIFRLLNEGNQAGLGPIAIARNMRSEVPAGPYLNSGAAYRSQLIARTETNFAQNASAISAYRDSDVVTSAVAMDGSDDPECAERDGTEFSFDDAEVELGNEHPNGTLTFAPVVSSGETPAADSSDLQAPLELNSLALPSGQALDEVETAISNIEQVHMAPGKAKPVKIKVGGSADDVFGNYNYRSRTVQIARMDPAATRATTYHELGHWLDQQLGPGTNLRTGAPDAKFDALSRMIRDESNRLLVDYTGDPDYALYLSRTEEIFARAYSQYIATKTGDSEALALLRKSSGQWGKQGFERWQKALDEYLSKVNLR